jgi:hypothetical protein
MSLSSIEKNRKPTATPLAVVYHDIQKLKLDSKNARVHSENRLAKSRPASERLASAWRFWLIDTCA